MKKLINFLIIIFSIISCGPSSKNNMSEPNGKFGDFRVVQIDNCEYVIYDYGLADQRVFAIAHKGNCKNHQLAKTKSGQISTVVIDGINRNNIEVNQNLKETTP